MNKVILIGRLTRDPEIRQTQNGLTTARYSLAVQRSYKNANGTYDSDFISCVCFKKTAEFAEKYLKKGMRIAVTGRIQAGSYQKQDGTKVYTTDVIVEEHEFCENKNGSTQPNSRGSAPQEAPTDGFIDIPDEIDEDLPFI